MLVGKKIPILSRFVKFKIRFFFKNIVINRGFWSICNECINYVRHLRKSSQGLTLIHLHASDIRNFAPKLTRNVEIWVFDWFWDPIFPRETQGGKTLLFFAKFTAKNQFASIFDANFNRFGPTYSTRIVIFAKIVSKKSIRLKIRCQFQSIWPDILDANWPARGIEWAILDFRR